MNDFVRFKKYDAMLPTANLRPSRFQRNKHPEDQIKRLAKIMKEHGIRQAIHISVRSGEICFGHGRWEAAKLNKWDTFPVVYQDFKTEEEEYSCVQSDNSIAHWAELDLSAINTDLATLGPDFDLDLLGIRDFSLDPEFSPTDMDLQPSLDEKKIRIFECPRCHEKFEEKEAKVID